jgi:hypothetical protein
MFYNLGYSDVIGQEAQHEGTYKIFVNSVETCDISYVPKNIYNKIPFIEIDGYVYAHPHWAMIDYLRIFTDPMTSWEQKLEKRFRRLYLLQKHYPIYQTKKPTSFTFKETEKKEMISVINKIYRFCIDRPSIIVSGAYALNYFKQYRHNILNLFEIDDSTKNYLTEKYSDIQFENTCSIHVRRGNYVERQHFHPLQTVDYYKRAISIIGEKTLFLIFSDDIDWCKSNLDFIENKIFISGNLDYQDLYLMSMCNHNIIANSSFSWWAAFLNSNCKVVLAPKYWAAHNANLNLWSTKEVVTPGFTYVDSKGYCHSGEECQREIQFSNSPRTKTSSGGTFALASASQHIRGRRNYIWYRFVFFLVTTKRKLKSKA